MAQPKDPLRREELRIERRIYSLLLVGLGVKISSEARNKIRQSNLLRWSNSEYRDKIIPVMTIANQNRRPFIPVSDEEKVKRGKARSEATRGRSNWWLHGVPFTKEHRENISVGLRRYHGTEGQSHNSEERWTPIYVEWRNKVLSRDRYSCQHCGSTECLHAHHIKSWKSYLELRYVVSNGLTLCFSCHIEEHSRWRKGKKLSVILSKMLTKLQINQQQLPESQFAVNQLGLAFMAVNANKECLFMRV